MENLTVLDSLEEWPVSIALASFSFDRLERQKILKMSPKDLVRQLPMATYVGVNMLQTLLMLLADQL